MKKINIEILVSILHLFVALFCLLGVISCALNSNYVGMFLYLAGFSVNIIFMVVKLMIISNIIKGTNYEH